MCLISKETRNKRRIRLRTAICPKCLQLRTLEGHHIYPKRFFGNNGNSKYKIYLCPDCHRDGENAIENYIPRYTKLTRSEYDNIHKAWFIDEPITIYEKEVCYG